MYSTPFSVPVPLCLYRGPFSVYGLGAGVAGARPERVMASTLPYTWLIAVGGMVLTAAIHLI